MRYQLSMPAFLVLVLLAPSTTLAQAESGPLAEAIQGAFGAGWRTSATALSSAQPHYAKAQAAAPRDARPAYAMALIAMKNSRYEDARKWLHEGLLADKTDLASQRALIWVEFFTRQYAAGLSGMQTAAESLAMSETGASPDERQALARSLGRMVGFLFATTPTAVSSEQLATAEQDLLGALPRALHVAFVEGKQQSRDKFEQMTAELGKQKDAAIEEQTQEKSLAQKKLEEDKGELTEAKDALTEEAKRVREKYTTEESNLNKDIAPLARRLQALDARARTLQNYLMNVDRDIERLIASATVERGRDPLREATFLREADRLRFQSRAEREEFLRIDREMAQVRAQGSALEGKLREAQAWLQGELRRLEGQGAKITRSEKGLKAVERKVSEPVTGASSRVRVTATRVASLSTYEEFPLEQEKQQLLDSLR